MKVTQKNIIKKHGREYMLSGNESGDTWLFSVWKDGEMLYANTLKGDKKYAEDFREGWMSQD